MGATITLVAQGGPVVLHSGSRVSSDHGATTACISPGRGGLVSISSAAALTAEPTSIISALGHQCVGGGVTIDSTLDSNLFGTIDTSTTGTGPDAGPITIRAGGSIVVGNGTAAAVITSSQDAGSCTRQAGCHS